MASASDPPAHPALQPADRLILPPLPPRAAVETSIGPPHYPAESTQSHAFVQPSLRARKGHANSDSFLAGVAAVSRPRSSATATALFPAIRILERDGSAKSGRARRVRAGSLGK